MSVPENYQKYKITSKYYVRCDCSFVCILHIFVVYTFTLTAKKRLYLNMHTWWDAKEIGFHRCETMFFCKLDGYDELSSKPSEHTCKEVISLFHSGVNSVISSYAFPVDNNL